MLTGILLAFCAAIATAASHVLAKDALAKVDFLPFVGLRLWAAFLAISLVLLGGEGGLAQVWRHDAGMLGWLALLGILSPLAVNLFLFAGYARLPVSHAVPLFHAYPAMMLLLGPLAFGHAWDGSGLPGIVLILAGISVFTRPPREAQGGPGSWFGIFATLAAALGMGSGALFWTDLGGAVSPLVICWWGCGVAAMLLTPWLLLRARRLRWGDRGALLKTAASGALVFALANHCSISATAVLPAPTVFAIVATAVLWTGLAARLTLRERWSRFQLAGACCVVAGITALGLFRF